MIYKRFYLVVILRVILITMNSVFLGFTAFQEKYLFSSIFFSALLLLQVVLLINFLNRINNQMETFFDYLKNDDPRIAFEKQSTPGKDKGLYIYFRNLAELVGEFRKREQTWHQLLQNTIEHATTGLVVFDKNHKIEIANRSAEEILDVHPLKYLDSIEKKHPGLKFIMESVTPGNRKIFKSYHKGDSRELLIHADQFRLFDRELKLIAFNDIRPELQDNEMESWQKLIRVLTHEINNTVSPLSSISVSIQDDITHYLMNTNGNPECKKVMDDAVTGLNIINDRVEGLLKFVREFRSITLPPQISPKYYRLTISLDKLKTLFKSDFEQHDIHFAYSCTPEDLSLFADMHLFEQVLINLCRNAVESLAFSDRGERSIRIICSRDSSDKVIVEVKDNGPGIPPEIAEKIFIPFFTTKPSGSGVGLSLSRMIIRKHNGTINFSSDTEGTSFRIRI